MDSTIDTLEIGATPRLHEGTERRDSSFMSARIEAGATVHIVDSDAELRESLRAAIEPLDIDSRGYAYAKDFLAEFDARRAGCLVIEVRMPDMSGLDLQQALLARGTVLPIIFVTAHADVPMCVRAMKRGALEFVEKPFNQQLLIEKIQNAIEFDRSRRAQRAKSNLVAARIGLLSEREREVLDMIFAGVSNREMAAALRITVRTVEAHRAKVMDKMRANSIVDLVRMMCLVAT